MDKLTKHLKETWNKMEEGFFGFGKKKVTHLSIDEIQKIITMALNREDGMEFRFYLGNSVRLTAGICDLIGIKNYVRPSAANRASNLSGNGSSLEPSDLQLISKEVQASFQIFCIDDDLRHKMRLFVSTTDPRKMVERLPKLEKMLRELESSGIEDLDPSGYGQDVLEWLVSFKESGTQVATCYLLINKYSDVR